MTNNADNKSPWDSLNDITNEFMEGQDFAIVFGSIEDARRGFDALREILTAPTVTYIVHARRIEDRKNKGIIYCLGQSEQDNLRGLRHDFKLVDPLGLVSNELRHRFK